MLRGPTRANGHKHPVSGPPTKQLRDGQLPEPVIAAAPGAGQPHAGTACDAAGRAASNTLLLPRVSQRLQEQAGHGATFAHAHWGEALQVSLLPTQISHQRKPEGTHATHTHGHHLALLDTVDTAHADGSAGRKNKWHGKVTLT